MALRVLLSVPFLLLMAFHAGDETLSGRDKLILVWLGFTGYYVASFFDFWGLEYISAALERLILFTYPGIVLLINTAYFKRPVRRSEIGALGLSWLGIALVFL